MPKPDAEAYQWALDAKFEKLAAAPEFGDPVRLLFEMAFDDAQEPSVRLQAARELVRMRYPIKKAIAVEGAIQNVIELRDLRRPAIEGAVQRQGETSEEIFASLEPKLGATALSGGPESTNGGEDE